ncbi:MAG: VWA domain-containing protein [Gammaproteobacteria bacterium]|nr:VWA domain-containing protein [Gammaproteobacteria bacterium]
MKTILTKLVTIGLLAVLAAGGARAAQPLDVLLVLDNSGSMRKNDPQYLTRQAVADFTAKLPADARVGMVIFDQKVRLAMPLTALGEDAQKAVGKALAGVDYHGQLTNTPAGVERAIYELKTNGRADAQKIVVLMTDGIVETGNLNADADRTRWLREDLAGDAADSGIRIYGVAFTEGADLLLIQSIAKRTNATYYRALQADELDGVFTKIDELLAAPPVVAAPPAEAPAAQPPVAQPPGALNPAPAPGTPAGPAPAPESQAPAPLSPDALAALSPEDRATLTRLAAEGKQTPEQLAAELDALAKDQKVPLSQIIKEMSGAQPGQVVITKPADSGETTTAESRTGFVLIAAAGVLIIVAVGIAAWWLRRPKTAKPVPAGAVATTTSIRGRSGPTVAEAMLVDINHLTSEAPRKLGEKPLMVGRVAGTDTDHLDFYVIDKATVGRRHAVLKQKDGAYWLVDQGSVNGTFVNGERVVGERRLRHGDKLRFHKFEFEFSQPDADPLATQNVSLDQGEPTLIADMAATIAASSATLGIAPATAAHAAPARPAPVAPDTDDFASTVERAAPAGPADDEDPFGLTATVVPAAPPNMLDITDEHTLATLERDKSDFFTDSGSHRPMHVVPPALARDGDEDETELTAAWHDDDDRPLSVPPEPRDEDDVDENGVTEFTVDLDSTDDSGNKTALLHFAEPEPVAATDDFDAEASAFFDDVTVGPVVDIDTSPRREEDDFLLATTRGAAVPDEPEIFDPEFGKSTVVLPTSQHGDATVLNPAIAKDGFDELTSTVVQSELAELPSEEGDLTLEEFMSTTSFDKSRLAAAGAGASDPMQNFMSTSMFERKSGDPSHQATAILVHRPTPSAAIGDVFDVTGAEGSNAFGDEDATLLPSEVGDDGDATRLMVEDDEEATRLQRPPAKPPKA